MTDLRRLRVVALTVGAPGASQLWTLRALSSSACELIVVQATHPGGVPRWKRARRLVREHGLLSTVSRVVGGRIGTRVENREERILDELFDFANLAEWWKQSGIVPIRVPTLNHADCEAALSKIAPDIAVRVSGGMLKPRIFRIARMATLNIHHGQAPLIRGMWSIPWAIVETRRDWIGATVHVIDEGIDTGTILWRGGPQIAPGDTNVSLFFRTHLQAVDALSQIIGVYASGRTPEPWVPPAGEISTYRSAPGVYAWLKYLCLGEGRWARVTIERGLRC